MVLSLIGYDKLFYFLAEINVISAKKKLFVFIRAGFIMYANRKQSCSINCQDFMQQILCYSKIYMPFLDYTTFEVFIVPYLH